MRNILQEIARDKRLEIEKLQVDLPLQHLQAKIIPRSESPFGNALSKTDSVNIIAELKQGSPSKGLLTDNFNPVIKAKQYYDGGATALSVLTDQKYFYGRHEFLSMVKHETDLPVLCKDFVVNRYQLYYARYMKADAILLIVQLLNQSTLQEYLKIADAIGLDCLVEAHDANEVKVAVESGAKIIGINNRNLYDFTVTLETSIQLAKHIPDNIIKVTESGIEKYEDVKHLQSAGFNCFLVGESLMTADDPIAHLKSLKGT